jgi:hypothetical protein
MQENTYSAHMNLSMFAVPQGQRQHQCNQQAHRYDRVLWPCALLICSSCAWIHAQHIQL